MRILAASVWAMPTGVAATLAKERKGDFWPGFFFSAC
jgi:hypothetical protein